MSSKRIHNVSEVYYEDSYLHKRICIGHTSEKLWSIIIIPFFLSNVFYHKKVEVIVKSVNLIQMLE